MHHTSISFINKVLIRYVFIRLKKGKMNKKRGLIFTIKKNISNFARLFKVSYIETVRLKSCNIFLFASSIRLLFNESK